MDHSPLRRLPAELRNTIYELVLTQHYAISIKGDRMYNDATVAEQRAKLRKDWKYFVQAQQMLALTRTCRQVRSETRYLFFAVNSATIELLWHPYFSGSANGVLCGRPFQELCRLRSPYDFFSSIVGIPDISYMGSARIEMHLGFEDYWEPASHCFVEQRPRGVSFAKATTRWLDFLRYLAVQAQAYPKTDLTLEVKIDVRNTEWEVDEDNGDDSVTFNVDLKHPLEGFEYVIRRLEAISQEPSSIEWRPVIRKGEVMTGDRTGVEWQATNELMKWVVILLNTWRATFGNKETMGQLEDGIASIRGPSYVEGFGTAERTVDS